MGFEQKRPRRAVRLRWSESVHAALRRPAVSGEPDARAHTDYWRTAVDHRKEEAMMDVLHCVRKYGWIMMGRKGYDGYSVAVWAQAGSNWLLAARPMAVATLE